LEEKLAGGVAGWCSARSLSLRSSFWRKDQLAMKPEVQSVRNWQEQSDGVGVKIPSPSIIEFEMHEDQDEKLVCLIRRQGRVYFGIVTRRSEPRKGKGYI
jgi:hypothetical protein